MAVQLGRRTRELGEWRHQRPLRFIELIQHERRLLAKVTPSRRIDAAGQTASPLPPWWMLRRSNRRMLHEQHPSRAQRYRIDEIARKNCAFGLLAGGLGYPTLAIACATWSRLCSLSAATQIRPESTPYTLNSE